MLFLGIVSVCLRFYPSYLFLFSQLASELTEQNSAKLCHTFASEPDFKVCVQNLECPLP